MSDKMTIIENSDAYQNAFELHRQILANGTIAASAMLELCKNLKQMRDSGAYSHLGYDTFDTYVEEAANIKKRQAYNYISTYERLGPEVLQSNAQLGITKLQLLAQVTEEQRDDMLASGAAEELSTREMKDLVDDLTKAREQISFLEEQLTAAEETKIELAEENAGFTDPDQENEIEELNQQIAFLIAEKAETEKKIADAKRAGAAEIKADLESKLKAKAEKDIKAAAEESEKLIAAARAEGIKAGEEAAKRGMQTIEKAAADAQARATELEKKLQVQGSQDTVLFALIFDELQSNFNKLTACISKIAADNPEVGEKYRGALKRYIGMMDQKI